MRLLRQELMFWMVMPVGAVAAFCFVPPEWPAALGWSPYRFAFWASVVAALLARGTLSTCCDGGAWFSWSDGSGVDGSGVDGSGGGDGGGD